MDKVKLLFLVGAGFWFLAGCAKQQQFKAVEQICMGNVQKLEAMQVAEDVLGKMHFTVEKADAEQGLIRTRPLAGAQFFEFWRSDNVGAFNFAEANLHTIRRIVELDISQQGEKLCIGCNVEVQRLSLSELKDSDRSLIYDKFSGRRVRASKQRVVLEAERKAWVDLGRDAKLATEILKWIESKLRIEN